MGNWAPPTRHPKHLKVAENEVNCLISQVPLDTFTFPRNYYKSSQSTFNNRDRIAIAAGPTFQNDCNNYIKRNPSFPFTDPSKQEMRVAGESGLLEENAQSIWNLDIP